MPISTRLKLPWPLGSQANDVESDLKKIVDALELNAAAISQVQNTLPAHDGVGKQLVWVRSQRTLYYDDGATWHILVQPIPAANLDIRKKWPVGSIRFTATPGLPTEEGHVGEWLRPNGGYISASAYPVYAAEVGTTYGPRVNNTVKLPTLTDRVPVMEGPNHGLGSVGGQRDRTLVANNVPAHTHPLINADHTHSAALGYNYVITSPRGEQHWITSIAQAPGGPGMVNVTFTRDEFNDQPMSVGANSTARSAFSIEQPWASVNALVKVH